MHPTSSDSIAGDFFCSDFVPLLDSDACSVDDHGVAVHDDEDVDGSDDDDDLLISMNVDFDDVSCTPRKPAKTRKPRREQNGKTGTAAAHETHCCDKNRVSSQVLPSRAVFLRDPVAAPGLRFVAPYYSVFSAYAKRRWCGRTLADVLAGEFSELSPAYYDNAVRSGDIRINSRPTGMDYVFELGDHLDHLIHRHETPVLDIPVRILAISRRLVVVDKPPSMPVYSSGRFHHNTVLAELAELLQLSSSPAWASLQAGSTAAAAAANAASSVCCDSNSTATAAPLPFFPLHVPDRLSSGVLVFASKYVCRPRPDGDNDDDDCADSHAPNNLASRKRGSVRARRAKAAAAAAALKAQDEKRDFTATKYCSSDIRREYVCMCTGHFPKGRFLVEKHIKRGESKCAQNIVVEGDEIGTTKPSVTEFEFLAYDPTRNASLVIARPFTDSAHQIRVHLKYLGHPICNDTLYNATVDKTYTDGNNQQVLYERRVIESYCPECTQQIYVPPSPNSMYIFLHCFKVYIRGNCEFENSENTLYEAENNQTIVISPFPDWAKF